jgi:dTDP-4-dehydrorhamnose reductase
MNVLITGASGMVGSRLGASLAGAFRLVSARHEAAPPGPFPSVALELLEAESLASALEAARADAVVHCAALADADRCEREPALAAALNRDAPGSLARLCQRRGLRLIVLSTDLVFAGDRPFLSEGDAPGPLSAYARTKLAGEDAVAAECPSAAILRLALVAGRGTARPTASEAIAWSLRAGRRLRLFTDQFRTPVDAESVAHGVARLLRGTWSGRYHLGGPERIDRFALGLRVARRLSLPEALLQPILQAEGALAALRPADVSLDSSRAARDFGWQAHSLDDAIAAGRLGPD